MTILHVPYRNAYHYWATGRSAIRVFCVRHCGNLNTGRHVQRLRGVKLNVTAKQIQQTVVWSSCYERQTPLDGRVRAAVCVQNRALRCRRHARDGRSKTTHESTQIQTKNTFAQRNCQNHREKCHKMRLHTPRVMMHKEVAEHCQNKTHNC
mgnify:CR=1 FL=1